MRICCALLLPLLALVPCHATEWFPVPVIADGKARDYVPLAHASRPWRICTLLPHGIDRYWWGVAWGLDEEARRQGVLLGIYEAGGYQFPAMQRAQLARCIQLGADAFVIGAIEARGLCHEIDQLKRRGTPVIDLVNGIDCAGVTAHSRVDFADMAREALGFIRERAGGGPINLGWLPGPRDAGWVLDAERGLRTAMDGAPVRLADGGYGPVDRSTQAALVRGLLGRESRLDYLLANAEAAAFAGQLVSGSPSRFQTQVVSLYATERVVEAIRQGRVLAAPTDSPVTQARIAIDLAVRALEQKVEAQWVSPRIQMLDRESLEAFDISRLMPPNGHWMIRQELPE
ncbi:TMAO reductase system periplasmic protein TorT [Pseudomonas sp. USHLN015]|uniref:TMAO reductase system periplasmic protein TorT n=1 Tax=Pseudomonas sp. USHLN015 TaxID=3081296 RepID=UPI00301E165C